LNFTKVRNFFPSVPVILANSNPIFCGKKKQEERERELENKAYEVVKY
jgi:hypothetical protein